MLLPPLLLLGLQAVAGGSPPPLPRQMHPGVLRAAMAGRGSLLGVPAGPLRLQYPIVGQPCGDFSCKEGNWSCLDGGGTVRTAQLPGVMPAVLRALAPSARQPCRISIPRL
eukprot:SAG22_NODE_625_length_8437_cov_5.263133_2_plen_111_part_00